MANSSERNTENVRDSDGEQGYDSELEVAPEMLREKAKEMQKQKNVNVAKLMWMMCLMDLPFTNQWSKSYDNKHKKTAIKAATHQLDSLVIHEELFVHDKNVNISSDECIKIDPQTSSLEPQTHYGFQLILSNLSSEPMRCELAYQIHTGSVPLGSSSYRLSKSAYIQPYSTWSKISGTFYFPQPGTFGTVPATVSVEKQDRQSLAMTEPSSLFVFNRSKNKEYNAATALY
ncbi:hypothetical protein G6F56_004384 [Rhizopus delemar]|nr:hypothetical protein G6F56_004384 [Rhizopus delemar]